MSLAECRYSVYDCAECHYAVCLYAVYNCAECHYAECRCNLLAASGYMISFLMGHQHVKNDVQTSLGDVLLFQNYLFFAHEVAMTLSRRTFNRRTLNRIRGTRRTFSRMTLGKMMFRRMTLSKTQHLTELDLAVCL
jgi:hypothetical protein